MKKILIIITLLLITSGCYDYRELNDMSIVSGIGIDYKDNEYIVSLEVTKAVKDGSSNEIETTIFTGKDSNISNAFLEAKNCSDKYVYMEHVNILLISKNISEQGIGNIVDYIVRDTSINSNYYMVVVDNPNDIFETKIENDSISNVITNTINYYLDNTTFDDLDIMASYMNNQKNDIAIPSIYLDDDKIIFNKIAYFNGDKQVGEIDNKLYMFLKLNSNNINFTKNNNTISIYNNKVDYKILKDKIIININGEGLVKEIDSKIDLENQNNYKYLSRIIEKEIKHQTEQFLNETLNNNSDLLGLKDKYYKKYQKNINNIKYEINVNITINKNGTIYEVLYDN